MARPLMLFLLLATATGPAAAQGKKKLMKLADQSFHSGDYYTAAHYYKELMQVDSSRLALLYKYASSLRMLNEYEQAEFYFQKIQKEDRKNEFPEATFWLAMMQKNNEKYKEAKKNFRKAYNKNRRDKSGYFYQKSAREMEACDFALQALRGPMVEGLLVENAGDSINTIHADFGAFFQDGLLYYSSLRRGESTIEEEWEGSPSKWIRLFRQKVDSTGVSLAEELPESINMEGFHNANGSFGAEGKSFYFSRCGSDNVCKIFKAKMEEGEFTGISELPQPVNLTGYSSTQPFHATIEGQEYLFFASNRPGGEGGYDIWYSEMKDGRYSKPVNAGKNTVNSMEDELSPFYHSPSGTLYFSSNWHLGFGGFDIFKSEGLPGAFKEPENLGFPLNSGANDFYFTLDFEGLSGYFTSNRKGAMVLEGETCCNDIYRFTYPKTEEVDTMPLAVKMVDELKKWLPVTLYFHNDEPNPRTTDTLTKVNYLDSYNGYIAMLETYKKEYSAGLNGEEADEAREIIEDFFEDQVRKGYNDLKHATEILQKVMEEGYHVELTLKGYASPLAKSDYNLNLTKRRIGSLKNYLSAYEEGYFLPYMDGTAENGGRITFVEMPFGSYKAAGDVSANLNDLKNSVYSKAAANERKIEIIGIALKDSVKPVAEEPSSGPDEEKEEKYPEPKVENPFFDFGKIDYGKVVEHQFRIKNEGDSDLLIYNARGSCGCTVPTYSTDPVPPGEEAVITVRFDSLGKFGKQNNTVYLTTNAVPKTVVLSISADVIIKK